MHAQGAAYCCYVVYVHMSRWQGGAFEKTRAKRRNAHDKGARRKGARVRAPVLSVSALCEAHNVQQRITHNSAHCMAAIQVVATDGQNNVLATCRAKHSKGSCDKLPAVAGPAKHKRKEALGPSAGKGGRSCAR